MERMGARRAVLCALAGVGPWLYLGWVRPWQLRWGATPEEVHRDLPGDELVPHPLLEATRAVTIAAPAAQVWPWLVQMGTGRGGYYAIDLLDNGARRSADRLRPELQGLAVGDVMPTSPDGTGFRVVRLEPQRLLVLHIGEAAVGAARGSVVVILTVEDLPGGRSRLVCRLRGDAGSGVTSRAYAVLLEIGDFVMVRLMLAGIRARAERLAASAVTPG